MTDDHGESTKPKRKQVQELAEELGLEVRAVIAAAREIGVAAQNRITRLHPNDEARLRARFAAPAQDDDFAQPDAE